MCGIVGFFNYRDARPPDRALCRRMMAAVAHRGPDDEGLYSHDPSGLILGHRRLSIIDLETGHQPMSNEDDTVWAILNGEIYNFRELRSELEGLGHVFRTKSDTEAVIHAYEQWGVECLGRLNGMYAIALWDEKTRTLTLARDPFGIKPLYHWDDGLCLVFGSEVKALFCDDRIEREVDPRALRTFLAFTYVPSPRTAFRGVQKVPPGHALVCKSSGTRLFRFHRKTPRTLTNTSEDEIVEGLREKIAEAVKRQMISDVPVGAMLSGGVDSSTVATLMTHLSGGLIQTFTVGFEGNFEFNEIEESRTVAKRIGSRHHEVVISSEDYADFLPKSIWHLEEPISTASTLAFFKVCELAREHVKVVLSGQGADEPFGGYARHLGEKYGRWYRAIPAPIRNGLIRPIVHRLPRNEQMKRATYALGESDPLARFLQVYATMDRTLLDHLYGDESSESSKKEDTAAVRLFQSDVASLDGLSQMLYLDTRLSLPDNLLMYGDKMSMAVALETRVPFLDLELMEFVESIPSSLKIKGWEQKYILKRAAEKWVGRDVIARRKIGFATPVDGWFRKELRRTVEDLVLDPGSGCRRFFRPEQIASMLDEHHRGRHDYKRPLFSLVTFEVWYTLFIRPSRWEF